jgi:hypothetical protein
MTAYEILCRMDKLLAKKENWCTHAYARSKTGKKVKVESRAAVAWCLDGALDRVVTSASDDYARLNAARALQDIAHTELGLESINDDMWYGFRDIKALIRDAKKLVKKTEAAA